VALKQSTFRGLELREMPDPLAIGLNALDSLRIEECGNRRALPASRDST
jgi:hypothetical protein